MQPENSHNQNELTIVTLCKDPFDRKDIGSLPYVNHVSEFNTMAGYLTALKDSAAKVKTPYLIYVDSDDPVPNSVILPGKKDGLVYGDFFFIDKGSEKRLEVGQWTPSLHVLKPWIIHKPILDTKKLNLVYKYLPILELDNQSLAYYFVAKIFGAKYRPNMKIVWNKDESLGLHKKSFPLRNKTLEFINVNGIDIENSIRNDSQFYELFSNG